MSLFFWRKTRNLGNSEDARAVAVTENERFPVAIGDDEDEPPPTFRLDQSHDLPFVRGKGIARTYEVPGIGLAAAYADGEAFGTPFTLHNLFRQDQPSGWITGVQLFDLDDEGIQVDVPLFTAPIAGTTDNNAFAPTDIELLTCVGVLPITTFYNWNVNQLGQYAGNPFHVVATSPNLYTQLVVRGAANIAAGALPRIRITVVPD